MQREQLAEACIAYQPLATDVHSSPRLVRQRRLAAERDRVRDRCLVGRIHRHVGYRCLRRLRDRGRAEGRDHRREGLPVLQQLRLPRCRRCTVEEFGPRGGDLARRRGFSAGGLRMSRYCRRELQSGEEEDADGSELLLVEELDEAELLHPAVARMTVRRSPQRRGLYRGTKPPPHCPSSAGGPVIQPAPTLLQILITRHSEPAPIGTALRRP